jgi:predicted nuclease with TOPRIM domain
MNLKDRIQIALAENYNELLSESLEYIEALNELQSLQNTLENHDLPIDVIALDKELSQAQAHYAALDELYDNLSDRYDALSDNYEAARANLCL